VLFTFSPGSTQEPVVRRPIVKKFRDAKVEPEGYVMYAYAAMQLFDAGRRARPRA
jgi:branched-chain amino acid transport system substrate-binding protein